MKDNIRYYITVEFKEKDHSLCESWKCKGLNGLKKILCDVLDLVKDPKTKLAVEPNLEKMTNSLRRYADEKFINSEFKRQKRNYALYLKIVEDATTNVLKSKRKLDDKTWISIENEL